MEAYEKLGAFYLGRPYDLTEKKTTANYLLYDSKDLLTHAVCVGMTGSGKTGLCISLLEEAAMDGIPAIIIDPKGDMANLLLSFPDMKPADFRPWINEQDAVRKGLSPDEMVQTQADIWRQGLADWGQDGDRIRRMRQNMDILLYTPGSSAGRQVTLIQSFARPEASILQDAELLQEQVGGTVGSLLGLLGLDADPIRSRDHILLSTLLTQSWQQGRDVDLADLIKLIQDPPIRQIGVMEMDTFYPAKERFALAMQLNNLLASPGFSTWMQGDPLDIDQMLYTPQGKPRLAIFSIAHLGDAERMFFVTIMLNQILSWTRRQPGTGSLRAILYMDEIYGYFPPVANPPSKAPLLTLLKQARAFGLGIMLTTQNPVDLDYKGLSNTGTWFIGRLQTERDKQRVLEGLEGAAVTQGAAFDRSEMDQMISGLGNRIFLMNNVHDDQPTLFETRWCMSYLCGPLTRSQIQKLHAAQAEQPAKSESAGSADQHADDPQKAVIQQPGNQSMIASQAVSQPITVSRQALDQLFAPQPISMQQTTGPQQTDGQAAMLQQATVLPVLPTDIRQYIIPAQTRFAPDLLYKPLLMGLAEVSYRDTRTNTQANESLILTTPITNDVITVNWDNTQKLDLRLEDLDQQAPSGARFEELPEAARQSKNFTAWKRDLTDWLYRNRPLELFHNPDFKLVSKPDETVRDFTIRLQQHVREIRDDELNQLRQKYAARIQTMQEKVRKSEQAVEREKEQAKSQAMQTTISLGATLLSAFLGKKAVSATSLGRATTAVRGASRTLKEKADIDRSKETVDAYQKQMAELEQAFKIESEALSKKYDPMNQAIETYSLTPLKKDILIKALVILWQPEE